VADVEEDSFPNELSESTAMDQLSGNRNRSQDENDREWLME
jgi:hypothetical protein